MTGKFSAKDKYRRFIVDKWEESAIMIFVFLQPVGKKGNFWPIRAEVRKETRTIGAQESLQRLSEWR
ncbi:hypothetical protein B5E43_00250 [Flavonifractor sp. An100]|nr:hypothetical protein B5E43_00250 [Flavonifractor sp. An100]